MLSLKQEAVNATRGPWDPRLFDRDLNASLAEGPFDLVMSFFAIHHVENKQRFFHDVLGSLTFGGLFLYADITVAADAALERSFLDGWVCVALRRKAEAGRPIGRCTQ